MQWRPVFVRPRGDRAQLIGRHGADRVDRRADAGMCRRGQPVHALGPVGRGSVGEPHLRALQVDTETACQITRVEQGDPDPGIGGRGDERLAQGVGFRVRCPVRGVVHVVELADTCDAGQGHLGIRRPGQCVVRVRVQPARHGVHVLTPRPEGSAAAVGTAAQRAVERVTVRVCQTGDCDTGQVDRVGRAVLAGRHRGDPLAVDLDQHAIADLVAAEPRVVGEVSRH